MNLLAFCENGQVNTFDLLGARKLYAAWKHTAKWDDSAILDYHLYSRGWLKVATTGTTKYDCADLAISLLVEFASRRGLRIKFTKGTEVFDSKCGPKSQNKSKSKYYHALANNFGAKHVGFLSRKVPWDGAGSGDVLVYWGSVFNHVRVIRQIIKVKNDKLRPVEEWSVRYVAGDDPATVPVEKAKMVSVLQDIAYDLDGDGDTDSLSGLLGNAPRRWRFFDWN